MNEEQRIEAEANAFCHYLSGRPASAELTSRYAKALSIYGLSALSNLKHPHWRMLPIRKTPHRMRLAIMTALLETDIGYNGMFRIDKNRMKGFMAFLFHGSKGVIKGTWGRIVN